MRGQWASIKVPIFLERHLIFLLDKLAQSNLTYLMIVLPVYDIILDF